LNRGELVQRLSKLGEKLRTYPLNPAVIAADLGELVVEVQGEWSEAPSRPRELVTVDDDGAGFVAAEVRSWRVEPKYGAKGSDAGCHTLVYFRGIEHAQSFDGDLHDAISTALRGGTR
jgi:hypothetical protein